MYQSLFLPHFLRQLKPLLKKYPSVKEDIKRTLADFDTKLYPHLGRNVYKVRLGVTGLARGKSKSLRLIVLVVEHHSLLAPVTIYFKGDKTNISFKELSDHLEIIEIEIDRSPDI
jgi:mRNA-degrading endonuclease RelE of RelBE toxin-antitoxin system